MHEALGSFERKSVVLNDEKLAGESWRLEEANARERIEWAVETYGDGLALSASFGGGEGMALLDMISKVTDKVTVLTIDTGFIFKETAEFREEVMRRYKLPVEVLRPALSVEEQVEKYGEQMRTCSPDLCCQIRKIEPLQKALQNYDAWMTGIRREQTAQRSGTKIVAWEENYHAAKIAPIADWTEDEVWAYNKEHEIAVNPLLHQGYKSIGCEPQTRPVHNDEDPRAGRWSGTDKIECGIHFVGGICAVKSLREQGLNNVEKIKLERHPLEVRQAIIDTYSKKGIESLHAVPGEMERLKWVGVYPQKQGGNTFMMRYKVPGGVLKAGQAKVLGEIATEFAEGSIPNPVFGNAFLDITTRQTVQMHWLKIEDIPEIWRRLEEVGMTTVQACGDSARNVLCCPVSGLDHEEVVDAYPVAQAINDFFTGNREYANLPRKFKMSVTGCLEDCAQAEINDIGLQPARHEDGTIGFNVRVGGGLSDGPRMASDIDVFIRPEQAVELTRAIAQVFGELGNRENRWTARMRYLVQELGPEGFRKELEKRVDFDLTPSGESLTKHYRGDHVGVHRQKEDGLYYVGLNVTVGRMGGESFVEAARLAEEYGDGEIRLATDQNLIITGVPEEKLDELLAEPLLKKHSPNPGAFERGVVACTGSEFCRFGIVETKMRAAEWAKEMDERVGDLGQNAVRMHFSGCSASCAQPQIGDIGFRGETAKKDREIVEGVDIGLGGSLGKDAAFIDWVEGAKPTDEIPDALESVFQCYKEERREGERFHEWARRKQNKELRRTLRGVEMAGCGNGSGA